MRPAPTILRSFAALSLIAALASCQKETADAPLMELTLRDELTFVIPPGNTTEIDLVADYDARASVLALLQAQGLGEDALRDVRIADARAVMIAPMNAPFATTNSVTLGYLEADGTRTRFAHLDPVPHEQAILDLSLVHEDLTPFFRQHDRTVHAWLTTTGHTGNDTTRVRFALTFQVKAGA